MEVAKIRLRDRGRPEIVSKQKCMAFQRGSFKWLG